MAQVCTSLPMHLALFTRYKLLPRIACLAGCAVLLVVKSVCFLYQENTILRAWIAAGVVPCICTRWSDSDVGCATCNGRGLMACSSCGGGGTAVPITAKLISRR